MKFFEPKKIYLPKNIFSLVSLIIFRWRQSAASIFWSLSLSTFFQTLLMAFLFHQNAMCSFNTILHYYYHTTGFFRWVPRKKQGLHLLRSRCYPAENVWTTIISIHTNLLWNLQQEAAMLNFSNFLVCLRKNQAEIYQSSFWVLFCRLI